MKNKSIFMIFCIVVGLSTMQAQAALIDIVDVSAPAINCIYDNDCTIVVTDTSDHFTLNGSSGDAFLQSRTCPPGEAGTAAEGLYGYEYRIDLRNLIGILKIPCITSFTINFDALVSLDYDGNGDLDDMYVVTQGGVGTVAPTVADKVSNTITFQFDPPVCAGGSPGRGASTFFFGLTSKLPPGQMVAQVRDTSGIDYDLNARAPIGISEIKPLDHFRCYAVGPGEPVNADVFLEDQFSAQNALVKEVFRFCNPVEKTHRNVVSPIQNNAAHLTFYYIKTFLPPSDIKTFLPPPPWPTVTIGNQFGDEQNLEVVKPLFLAAPTRKLTPIHPNPGGLDHFQCYQVKGESVDTWVSLEDQFIEESAVKVSQPKVLCNPVEKTYNGETIPIQHPEDHLVCYQSEGKDFMTNVKIHNQFGYEYLTLGQSDLLCVPSRKFVEPILLDHFKCYPTEGTEPVDTIVSLRDPFGEGTSEVDKIVRFCNPVQKSRVDASGKEEVTPIENRDHHLAFYQLKMHEAPQTRFVQVSNQLGKEQKIKVSKPRFLAVPAQKTYPRKHKPPQGLDHFMCYEAEGEPLEAEVKLIDQFLHEPEVKKFIPSMLCNPVAKKHRDVKIKIHNQNEHLMCYTFKGGQFEAKVGLKDQFGEQVFKVHSADLLCLPSQKKVQQLPRIEFIGHISVHDINGGNVSADGPGNGLANFAGYDRPFGGWIPIHGNIPAGIDEFRVVYRLVGTLRPANPADAPAIPVVPATNWRPRDWQPATMDCSARTLYSSTADGWFNATEYRRLEQGEGMPDDCNAQLALTVWDSNGPAVNTEGHYVIWLQWRTGAGPIQEEPFDHHVQLDNKEPNNLALDIPGGACASYGPKDMPIMVSGHIDDAHFWRYRLRVFGNTPPDAHWYPPVNYDDPGPEAAHVGPAGTGPGNQNLHNVDVHDLQPPPLNDCCYGIRLRAWDRTIVGNFYPGTNSLPWHLGRWDEIEITFDYTP